MKKTIVLFLLVALPFIAGSHIGNPVVTFEGNAGPYSVLVLINPPDVIPGTATVDIYIQSGDVSSVWAKPVYWFAGDEGTPGADELISVAGEPGHYSGQIWFMDTGTSGIQLEVKGRDGDGQLLVPVMAVSTAQKEMPASLGWILFGLGIFLVLLMITIIRASVSDGLIKPDETITRDIRRKGWVGTIASTVMMILILWGGKTWWDSWAVTYNRYMYRPMKASATLRREDHKTILTFRVDTTRLTDLSETRDISLIIPDHGKLMHMFLVKQGTLDAFAHIHPRRKDSLTFETSLPPLPPGKYLVFADITRLSGFSETIPGNLEIPDQKIPAALISAKDSASVSIGRDDTWFATNPVLSPDDRLTTDGIIICGKPGVKTILADGSSAIWEHDINEPLIAGKAYSLKFAILDEKGEPAKLEPYLGMMGHAVVLKTDGSTYIHLHPVGNYSLASQQAIVTRFEKEVGPVNWDKISNRKEHFRDSIDAAVAVLDAMNESDRNKLLMGEMTHEESNADHPEHSAVTFPYVFPSPGEYRIWIQMKRNGKILNSAFDAVVE